MIDNINETYLQSRIIYRDALILVLDKPAGIAVHAGGGKSNALDQYLELLKFGLPNKPELAHRLDKDTSGCLILGRHRQALKRLGNIFEQNLAHKTYYAISHGKPPQDEGIIDLALSKISGKSYHWWMKPNPEGLNAVTKYKVLASDGDYSYIELTPLTGRTHQLRVHLAAINCPIYGDKIYGIEDDKTHLMLHAGKISVPIYPKKEPVLIEAPLPNYMEDFVNSHFFLDS